MIFTQDSYFQNQINMPTIIFCHQLHNQNQIPTDSHFAQPIAILLSAIKTKWLKQMEDMDWSVNKQPVKWWDKKRSRNWLIEISVNVRTNFMEQCLLSRTPRSQFNTTDGSNQVTRKFQFRVTPVNFSWGRPTVAWGWTDLGHQGSMSVFTRNKCYHILVLPRFTFSRAYHQSQILTQPHFWDLRIQRVLFECPEVKKDTFLPNHLARKISTGTIQKDHLFFMMSTHDSHFQFTTKSTC